MNTVSYQGWDGCVLLSDGVVELIATTAIGPRIMRFGFVGGPNLFFEKTEDLGQSGGSEWRIYGGHRFWHAPEAFPRTYAPDNSPVERHAVDGNTLKLVQPVEPSTGVGKEIEITLDPATHRVTVLHRAVNWNPWAIELAPWCLTAMAGGGRAIIPHEKYRAHSEYLLPARPLVLWHYTDMSDPRFTWGPRYIQLRQDRSATTKQKIGVLNTLGWAAYALAGHVFVKRFAHRPGAAYPDFGANCEVFTDSSMLEMETLGPLTRLRANGGAVEFTERWELFKAELGRDDDSLVEALEIRGLGGLAESS